MVRSILWRLIGCLCFWWSLGLALFFISFGVNRIEKSVQNSANPERILSDQRPDRNTDAEFQDSVQTMENTGMGQSIAVQVSENSSIRAEKTITAKVALTFDDGPHPVYTPQLLDGLKERGVHVTFFVVGKNILGNEALLKRMETEGHLIGNHTYSHIQLTSGNRETFREELVKTNEILKNITGETVSFVRPPYGSWDKSFEKELNMFPVLWNIDPLDWCSHNAECIAAKVVEKAGDGDIILMHDYYDTSVTAALEVVDVLQKRGFQFVTVEEILFD